MNNNITEKDFEEVLINFHHKLIEVLKKEAGSLNCTISQLEVIRYVVEKEDPTMKDIALHLKLKPPSVTVIIEFLQANNFIKREFDKEDRRIVRIKATTKSKKLFASMKDKKLLALKNMFIKLEEKDKKELIRIMSNLTK